MPNYCTGLLKDVFGPNVLAVNRPNFRLLFSSPAWSAKDKSIDGCLRRCQTTVSAIASQLTAEDYVLLGLLGLGLVACRPTNGRAYATVCCVCLSVCLYTECIVA